MLGLVIEQHLVHLVHVLGTEQIGGVQQFAILKQMAVSVPQARIHITLSRFLGDVEAGGILENPRELSVHDAEAMGFRQAWV